MLQEKIDHFLSKLYSIPNEQEATEFVIENVNNFALNAEFEAANLIMNSVQLEKLSLAVVLTLLDCLLCVYPGELKTIRQLLSKLIELQKENNNTTTKN